MWRRLQCQIAMVNSAEDCAMASPGRYNLTIQSMIEFHSKMIQFNFWFKRKLLKMIQFNFWFKRKLSKMIQFNFQFKRKLSGFNSKKYSIRRKKHRIQLKKYLIQNYSWLIQFNNIFNSKLFLANSIQWNIQSKSWMSRGMVVVEQEDQSLQ